MILNRIEKQYFQILIVSVELVFSIITKLHYILVIIK